MARKCDLTGTGVMSGNNVSHANNRTRRRFLPNLREVTLTSDALKRKVPLRITAATLRSVDHNGGLDNYLITAKANSLTLLGRKLRNEIKKAAAALSSAA